MIISRINQSIFLLICILKIKEVTICSLVNSFVLTRTSCLVGEKASKATQKLETGRSKKVPSCLVQSLNSPSFPPYIGAEPGRAKEESRITCMRMLRTNQSKTYWSQPRCSLSFSARALKENIFFDVDIVVKT